MLKEDLEKAILHANICLKKWAKSNTELLNQDNIKSLINGWLVRVLSRNSFSGYRDRKHLSANLKKDLFYTVNKQDWYITSITTKYCVIPYIDYEELNKQAILTVSNSSYPTTDLNTFSLDSINQIKFH